MNEARLERMAKLLDADAANPNGVQFNLRQWAGPAGGHDTDGYYPATTKVKVDCGTMACGMGLAAVSGEFEPEGLTYTFLGHEGSYMLCPSIQTDGTYTGFDAARELFDIDHSDALYLFDPDYYPPREHKGARGERYMARRIRAFIKGEINKDYHPDHS